MGAKSFWASQDGHIVSVLSPQNTTGGVTGQAFNLAGYDHASIILQQGAVAAASTKILVNACSDTSGTGATAIPFTLFAQETAGTSNDVLGTKVAVTSAGYTPTANCVQLQITNGANANYASAVAVLSSGRFTGDQSPTATT